MHILDTTYWYLDLVSITYFVYIVHTVHVYIYLLNLVPTFFWGENKKPIYFPPGSKIDMFFEKNLCFFQYTYISNVLGNLCGYKFSRFPIQLRGEPSNIIKTAAQGGPKPGPGDAPVMVNLNMGTNLRLGHF
jgi:hypothetical protein